MAPPGTSSVSWSGGLAVWLTGISGLEGGEFYCVREPNLLSFPALSKSSAGAFGQRKAKWSGRIGEAGGTRARSGGLRWCDFEVAVPREGTVVHRPERPNTMAATRMVRLVLRAFHLHCVVQLGPTAVHAN